MEGSLDGLAGVDPARVHTVRYDELVRSPDGVVPGILDFLGLEPAPAVEAFCRTRVSDRNLGKWRHQLDDAERQVVQEVIAPAMARAGLPLD